jgi:hypothetical protein
MGCVRGVGIGSPIKKQGKGFEVVGGEFRIRGYRGSPSPQYPSLGMVAFRAVVGTAPRTG